MFIAPNTALAAGSIIIENGKILLCREIKHDGVESPFFMLPGGGCEEFDSSFEETCRREAKEELGIEIEILRPLLPMFFKRPDRDGHVILIHFLSKRLTEVIPSKTVTEWGWYEVSNLPENCAPSIREVLESYFNEPRI
jgi:ADP-ribose pyrophosphatase YjhB (NUDIX family)